MKKEILALLMASGCASGLGANEMVRIEMKDENQQQITVDTYWQSRSDCINVIDDELLPAFYEATDRIFNATGIKIEACEGGTPLHIAPKLSRETAIGETGFFPVGQRRWIRIAERVPELQYAHVIAHELLHWQTGFMGHAENGLMAAEAVVSAKLNETSLDFVCKHTECSHYQPEN